MAAVLKVENLVEARIARLESDVTHIRSDISEMKSCIRDLQERLGKLELKVAESTAMLLHKIDRTSLVDRVLMCVLICGAPFAERLVKML